MLDQIGSSNCAIPSGKEECGGVIKLNLHSCSFTFYIDRQYTPPLENTEPTSVLQIDAAYCRCDSAVQNVFFAVHPT